MRVLEPLRCSDIVAASALCLILYVEFSIATLFTDLWAVHVEGGVKIANEVARRHGFINKGQVSAFHLLYLKKKQPTNNLYLYPEHN